MKLLKFLVLFFALVVLVNGQTTTSISKSGITFTFSTAREFGQFDNGDYWVQGPVTVTDMTPAWDPVKERNGWMVNPGVNGAQAFSGKDTPLYWYNPALRPDLPLTITQGSLIKTIGIPDTASASGNTQSIKTAVVLTVLSSIPTNRGVGYFRPPYNGTDKPLIPVSNARWDLIPSLTIAANAPTLTQVKNNFSLGLRLEHFARSRAIRPTDAFPGGESYQPRLAKPVNEAMLRLMGPESPEQKREAFVEVTQAAIDKAYAVYLGYRNTQGDGHDPNHRIFAIWGAVTMNLTDIIAYLPTAFGFHEDRFLYQGLNTILWGETETYPEKLYWDLVNGIKPSASKSQGDPYKYVDGGNYAGLAAYQSETSQILKACALIGRIFPQMKDCFPPGRFAIVSGYAQRWVDVGYWFSPDPVAPYDGVQSNYGITYGPNGSGSFIAGAGRDLAKHGTLKDGGQNVSLFVNSMWTAYSTLSPSEGDTTPPTFQSAAINVTGTTLQVTFSENVQGVNAAHYTINGGSTLSSPVTAGRVVTFTVSPALVSGTTYNLSYTSGAGRTADIAGNLLATFSSQPVANNSLETVPTPPRPGSKNKSTGRRGAFSQ